MTRAPRMSVVVGSNNARASIVACVSMLVGHGRGDEVEVVVVDNSTDGTAAIVKARFPGVRLIPASLSALIPELWGEGIRVSRGEIVAITTAHCVPARDWVSAMLKAHEGAAAAVGGAIESAESTGLVDWAVYFCRYSQYMLPFEQASFGRSQATTPPTSGGTSTAAGARGGTASGSWRSTRSSGRRGCSSCWYPRSWCPTRGRSASGAS